MQINNIKYSNLVGIGEASHGTSEFQRVRLDIIKYLHSSPIQVFIEANYVAIELLKIPGATKAEYIANVKASNLFNHLKSDSFCNILWYLHSNRIPYFGVDVRIHSNESYQSPVVKWIKNFRGERDTGMQKLINLLWDRSCRGIFLAHNFHISDYVGFSGTKIGFATLHGTMTVRNNVGKFERVKFNYTDQPLNYKVPRILKTKKWFYSVGETGEKEQYEGNKFDYIIYIPHTSAI